MGVVTTTRVQHASPAGTYAHTVNRNWYSDADMPAAALEEGCRDIAAQLISNVDIDVRREGPRGPGGGLAPHCAASRATHSRSPGASWVPGLLGGAEGTSFGPLRRPGGGRGGCRSGRQRACQAPSPRALMLWPR